MKNYLCNRLTFFIFLFFVLSFAKSNFIEIEIKEEKYSNKYTINSESEFSKFLIKGIKYFNYLKIVVESKGQYSTLNPIISYYQNDSNLMTRKQLSQGLVGSSTMWLNKEQIKENFYLTVECPKTPCNYELYITKLNTTELIINEQYTYYVTEQNQNLSFSLLMIDQDKYKEQSEKYKMSVWARGNRDIKTKLEGITYDKLSKYNYYRINFDDYIKLETRCKFVVNGKIGDLINIGFYIFSEEDHGEYKFLNFISKLPNNGIEMTNYLKPYENHTYNFLEGDITSISYAYDFDNKKQFKYEESNFIYSYGDDLFYSLPFLSTTKYDGEGNNKFSPQINGIYYFRGIEKGTIVGLIPMKPEEDFNILTYEIFQNYGTNEIFIYECDNYPLCHLDKIDNNKLIKVEEYKSYYYSYRKNEWDENITPISKNQKMLLIKCKEGIEFLERNLCAVNVNMKTDKNKIYLTDFNDYNAGNFRFIAKDSQNSFYFKGDDKIKYLNIEVFSGDIDITLSINQYDKYEINNKKLFIIPKNVPFDITLKGKENSVYSIYDYHSDFLESGFDQVGLNYLHIIKDDNITFMPLDYYDITNDKYPYYFGIFPLNCDIIISNNNTKDEIELKKNEFYQKIINFFDTKYTLKKEKDEKESSCLFYTSLYQLDDIYGITLSHNISQSFKFEQNYDTLKFSYPHTQKDNDISLELNLINEGKYKIELYLNNVKFNDSTIEANDTITLKSTDIKNKTNNFREICKILIKIQSQNKEKESILNINIKSISSDNNNNNNNKTNRNIKVIVIIAIALVSIIGIILVVVILICLKTISQNKNLSVEVNTVSFKGENQSDDDNQEGLLY